MDNYYSNALDFLTVNFNQENILGTFNYIYSTTTENIAGFMRLANNCSSSLVVGASGDHTLACVANGALRIVVFDRNPAALLVTQLKVAAAQVLSFEDYVDFFTVDNNWSVPDCKFFSVYTYNTFQHKLPEPAQEFWAHFFKLLRQSDTTPQTCNFFGEVKHARDALLRASGYLTSELYARVQSRIVDVEISYIETNINDLSRRIPEGLKFNLILFSNISDYLEGVFPNEPAWRYIECWDKFTTDFALKHLAFDGEFFYTYIYRATTGPGWSEIDDFDSISKKLKPFRYKTFPAMCRERDSLPASVDCVLVKQKGLGDTLF